MNLKNKHIMEKYRKLTPRETREEYKRLMRAHDGLAHANKLFTYPEVACCELAPLLIACNERAINFFNEYGIKEEFSSFMKRMIEEVSAMKNITC